MTEGNLQNDGLAQNVDQITYGGCEGPDAMYIKLISSDDFEFIIKKEHAFVSSTIKSMISGPGAYAENETNEIKFHEIPSYILRRVCEYFAYNVKYTGSRTEVPEFTVDANIGLELTLASNFLDC